MDPLASIDGVSGAWQVGTAPTPPTPVPDADAESGASFASRVTGAIDELQGLQTQSDALKVAAVTGDLDDIHSAMIASSRAAVTLELVAAVRNKGVDAFTEIMRMQA